MHYSFVRPFVATRRGSAVAFGGFHYLLMSGVFSNAAFDSRQGVISELELLGLSRCLPVREHFLEALVICAIYGQFVCVLPGHLGRLFAPEVTAHPLATHQFPGSCNMDSGLGPFVCFKFGHLPVLLLVPVCYRLGYRPRPSPW